MRIKYSDIIKEINIKSGLSGKGIGVAVFDTGVFPHEDLKDRVIAFGDFVKDKKYREYGIKTDKIYDNNGHGTHVAGIIAGSGRTTAGKYRGIAPGANIIGVKVLNYKGTGKVDYVIEGVKWVVENRERYNIRVANFSVGSPAADGDAEQEMFIDAIRRLNENGIIVVAAAGNNGPLNDTITFPGICKEVITVGSSDDDIPIKVGNSSRMLRDYSGRGRSGELFIKPDITAPGSHIISCLNSRKGFTVKSGTSMSTAVVSGAICLYLEKYKLANTEIIREKLCRTAYDNGRPKNEQGCGIINISGFLEI